MDEFQDPGSAAVLAHFLLLLRDDRAQGIARSREEYLGLFPGHAELIARELDSLAEPTSKDAADAARFGAYRVLQELGRGGQGEVYLAEDTRLGRRVALKVLRGLATVSRERLERFRREALAASRIDHPGICTVYESGVEGGIPFLAMRYVEGQSLAARIAAERDAGMPVVAADTKSTLALFEKIARAVHAAHEAGILHRDLKPQNVVITPAGEPVVLDFGLAADLSSTSSTLTRSGDVFGTPHYMAPEQIQGRRDVGRSTDVWALGVSLFEALAHRRPFEAPTPEALLQQILRVEAPSLRRISSRFSRDLATLVATALAKDPAHRYRTALDLADELARVRRGEPIRARPTALAVRAVRWARREPVRCAAVALAAALVALAGYLAARWPELRAGEQQGLLAQVEEQLELGYLNIGEGSETMARECFEKALVLDPASTEALAGIALAHSAARRDDEGLLEIERRGEGTRDPDALRLVRIGLLRRAGRAEVAAALETSSPPSSPLALFLRAKLTLDSNCAHHDADQQAIQTAQRLILQCVWSSHTTRPLYHFELAHILTHTDPDAARVLAKSMETLWSESAATWFWIGFCLPEDENDACIAAYEKATALHPRNSSAWTNLGLCLIRAMRLDEAEQALLHALSLRAEIYAALDGLARIHHRRGELEKAIELGRRACELEPGYAMLLTQLGTYLEDHGDLAEAEERYREAQRCEPDHVRSRLRLALLLENCGRFAEALELMRPAAAKVDDPAVYFRIARCCTSLGDHAGAAAACREVLARQPDYAEAECNLGHTLRRLGQFAAARDAFRRGHELGKPRPNWSYPSDLWLANAERMVDLEKRLDQGEAEARATASAEDCALLGEIAAFTGRDVLAVSLWEQAFEREPELARILTTGWRELGAAAAARIGAATPEAAERARWRTRSVQWLEEELAGLRDALDRRIIQATHVRDRLRRWQSDPELDLVRGEEALRDAAPEERARIAGLWQGVEGIAADAESQIPHAPSPPVGG